MPASPSRRSSGSNRDSSKRDGSTRDGRTGRGAGGFAGKRSGKRGFGDEGRGGSKRQDAPKSWGSVARRGASSVRDDDRRSTDRFAEERSEATPDHHKEVWIRDDEPRRKGKASTPTEKFRLPDEAIAELESHVGAKRLERLVRYLRDAARAYAAERWGDSRKALKVLLDEAPEVPTVKELNAMLLYRTGKYKQADIALRDAHLATLSFDLYPALMDCNRALKNYSAVEELWTELKAASPSAEVTAEGRIVVAGALADQGEVAQAIAVLSRAPKPKRKIGIHHLRTWYVLGDLYDRSGEVGLARTEFQRILEVDEEFADVQYRLENLGQ